jgi:predicted nucleotidyltransferase
MADRKIVKSVQKYLRYLTQQGIPISFGVLYGSYAKDTASQWSDIDLLVVSSRFDEPRTTDDYKKLWGYAARTDNRIEPIPVGERQFEEDDSSAIIEIARREGQIIPLAE